MSITAEEYARIETEIREKIKEENRAKKSEWRRKNAESIKLSNDKYYRKLREMKILAQAAEIQARRKQEEQALQGYADGLAKQVSDMDGGGRHDL